MISDVLAIVDYHLEHPFVEKQPNGLFTFDPIGNPIKNLNYTDLVRHIENWDNHKIVNFQNGITLYVGEE